MKRPAALAVGLFAVGLCFGGCGDGRAYRLAVVNADGSGYRTLTPSGREVADEPAWTPDSRSIVAAETAKGMEAWVTLRNAATGRPAWQVMTSTVTIPP